MTDPRVADAEPTHIVYVAPHLAPGEQQVPIIAQPAVQMTEMQPGVQRGSLCPGRGHAGDSWLWGPPAVPLLTICDHEGKHIPNRSFGPVGIIMGIVCCPCGLIWTCTDTRTTCTRCGEVLKKGGCFSG